jgi:hypothetical protein
MLNDNEELSEEEDELVVDIGDDVDEVLEKNEGSVNLKEVLDTGKNEKSSGVEETKVDETEIIEKEDEDKELEIELTSEKKTSKSKEDNVKNESSLFSAQTVATKETNKSVSTTWDVSSMVSDITEVSFEEFDADLSGCEYEGFDPMRTLEVLAAYAEEDGIDQEQYLRDMKFFAPFIAMRGTNKKSIVERTREDKRPIIENLLKRYKVVENNNKGGHVSKDTIILSRIISCFPVYVSTALSMGKIEAKCLTEGLPLYLHHSAGASLISKSDSATYNLWLTWSKAHDKLINGKNADEKKVEQFGKIIHESNNVEDSKRARLAKLFSMYESNNAEKDKDNKTNDTKE